MDINEEHKSPRKPDSRGFFIDGAIFRKVVKTFQDVFPLFVGLSFALTGVSVFNFKDIISEPKSTYRSDSLRSSLTLRQVADIEQKVRGLSATVNELQRTDTTNHSVDYVKLEASIKSLDNRLATIEKVILESPEKALTIPLLRKDLDNYSLSHTTRFNDLSQSLNSAVNQIYTVIGTVLVVLGLGILGFFVSARARK